MSRELSGKIVELYRQGRCEEAEKLLDEAVHINPKTCKDYLKRGTALSFVGRRIQALADFERALELDPGNAEAHMRRGEVLLCSDKPQEALEECEEAIRLAPNYQEAYRSKGNVLMALGRYEEAATYYGKLVERFPDSRDFWELNRAAALSLMERYKESLAILDTIAIPPRIDPFPSYSYYLSRAGALARLERFDDALDDLAEGMKVTKKEKGCIPCFVNNCWRVPYFESLRKPPFRERLEAIIGPNPKAPKE